MEKEILKLKYFMLSPFNRICFFFLTLGALDNISLIAVVCFKMKDVTGL